MKKIIFKLSTLLILNLNAIDNPHFYRASHFFGEPRIAKDYLTSFDVWFGGGETTKGLNCNGCETNILNIYGNENIKFLAKNVPDSIVDKFQNNILIDLWTKDTGQDFSKLKFLGKFNTLELDFDYHQNFICGFFGQIYLPVRKLQISRIVFDDLSTADNAGTEINFIQWRKFISNLEQNLTKVGINYNRRFKHTGVGDLTILGGWACNYQNTSHLDFIDATLKLGVLFPTGRQTDINNLFELPQGYNGHYAIPLTFNISAGLFDWLTFGVYSAALFFFDKTKKIRMKTAKEQNGFIKLESGHARIDKGTLWTIGAFVKADHVAGGGSFLLAYRFDKENRTILNPCDCTIFDSQIINSDRALAGWQMHTININLEYDFATLKCPCLPRIGIFFDIPVGGRQIFKTTLSGFSVGIDYAW